MQLSRQTFAELRDLVHRLCGLAIGEEKTYLIRHRLEPVARGNGCRTFEELARRLRGADAAYLHDQVIEAITTGETAFFRDGHPFEAFRLHVLPRLGETLWRRRRPGARVRIWCAAASTGQEPYSVAMLIQDYVNANRARGATEGDFEILATDISSKVLAAAVAAEYGDREVARGLSLPQRDRYLRKQGTGWVVLESIRELVEFRRANLIRPFSGLGTFDVIFCRNVLIYFDDATRRRICDQLYAALADDGSLFLGTAESLYGLTDRFESHRHGETLVYRKRPITPSPSAQPAR